MLLSGAGQRRSADPKFTDVVKDPDFIALSKAQADVKFLVYMNSVRRWKKSAKNGQW